MWQLRSLIRTKLDSYLRELIAIPVYEDLHHRLYSKVLKELGIKTKTVKQFLDWTYTYASERSKVEVKSSYDSDLSIAFKMSKDPYHTLQQLVGHYRFHLIDTAHVKSGGKWYRIKDPFYTPYTKLIEDGGILRQTMVRETACMARSELVSYFRWQFSDSTYYFMLVKAKRRWT